MSISDNLNSAQLNYIQGVRPQQEVAKTDAGKEDLPKVLQGETGEVVLDNLVDYIKGCDSMPGITNDGVMKVYITRMVKAGAAVANDIEAGKYLNGEKPEPEDVINLEWFLRAAQAVPTNPDIPSSHRLYDKGSMKVADPERKLAQFFVNAQGTRKGVKTKPYGRWSSHWIEDQKQIREKPVLLPDGKILCFSKKSAAKAKKENPGKEIIRYDGAAIGIDFRAKKGKTLGMSGKNTGTMMVMVLPDGTVGIKNEGFSAAPIKDKDLLKENLLHGVQFFKKATGRKDASRLSLGEDRLPEEIKKTWNQVMENKNYRHLSTETRSKIKDETKMGNPPSIATIREAAQELGKIALLDKNENSEARPKLERSVSAKIMKPSSSSNRPALTRSNSGPIKANDNKQLMRQNSDMLQKALADFRSSQLTGQAHLNNQEELPQARGTEVVLPSLGKLVKNSYGPADVPKQTDSQPTGPGFSNHPKPQMSNTLPPAA